LTQLRVGTAPAKSDLVRIRETGPLVETECDITLLLYEIVRGSWQLESTLLDSCSRILEMLRRSMDLYQELTRNCGGAPDYANYSGTS